MLASYRPRRSDYVVVPALSRDLSNVVGGVGFEPTNTGFSVQCLKPLGYPLVERSYLSYGTNRVSFCDSGTSLNGRGGDFDIATFGCQMPTLYSELRPKGLVERLSTRHRTMPSSDQGNRST